MLAKNVKDYPDNEYCCNGCDDIIQDGAVIEITDGIAFYMCCECLKKFAKIRKDCLSGNKEY